LKPGENKLLLDAEFGGRSSGILCKLRAVLEDGKVVEVISDKEWMVYNQNEPNEVVQAAEVDAWGVGRWGYDVTFAEENPGIGLPIFKKSFSVDRKVENALVHVTGLGHFELFLNGEKVGQNFLDPAWSVYEKPPITRPLILPASSSRERTNSGLWWGRDSTILRGIAVSMESVTGEP
jgi:hypothetical protein